jgi:competence/damage-inducible protein CinA-like protein
MPVAEIIAIGTELLLGESQDTNTSFIARALREAGIDLYRTTMIGDNPDRIAQAIREAMSRADIILTTGGLGPTIDDPARQAVALAVGVPLEFQPQLWTQIQERFKRYGRLATENNRRQAYIPQGSIPIENPVGTAPSFIVETGENVIASMPGVPREMEHMLHHTILPYLTRRYSLSGTIMSFVLHTAGVGESQVDEWISDLEESANPTVGLLAHPGQVDIRITAKADSNAEAQQMIAHMEAQVRARLGEHIYGSSHEKLEDILSRQLQERGWKLAILECGLEGWLVSRLASVGGFSGRSIEELGCSARLRNQVDAVYQQLKADVCVGASLERSPDKQVLQMVMITPTGVLEATRSWGGPPALSILWATNIILDFIRRNLMSVPENTHIDQK